MNFSVLLALAALSCAAAVALSSLRPDLGKLCGVIGGVLLLIYCLDPLGQCVTAMKGLLADSALAGQSSLLLRVFGVALTVQIGADLCRDAGQASLGERLEFAGKVGILLLALPLISSLLSTALEAVRA